MSNFFEQYKALSDFIRAAAPCFDAGDATYHHIMDLTALHEGFLTATQALLPDERLLGTAKMRMAVFAMALNEAAAAHPSRAARMILAHAGYMADRMS